MLVEQSSSLPAAAAGPQSAILPKLDFGGLESMEGGQLVAARDQTRQGYLRLAIPLFAISDRWCATVRMQRRQLDDMAVCAVD